jgi:hypothetical protein
LAILLKLALRSLATNLALSLVNLALSLVTNLALSLVLSLLIILIFYMGAYTFRENLSFSTHFYDVVFARHYLNIDTYYATEGHKEC